MTLAEQKQALRKAMRARLAALRQEERQALSAAACAELTAAPAFLRAEVILAYQAMPQECDPAAAVAAALRAGKRVAYPLCLPGNRLALYEPLSPDSLQPGKYGITEPVPALCRRISPDEVGFAVIPGIAFGRDCSRLGRGAGYYDRLLPELRCMKAGFCFGFQVEDAVPAGELDVKMDTIVSNLGIIVNKLHSSL